MAMQKASAPFTLCLAQFIVAALASAATLAVQGDQPTPLGPEKFAVWKTAVSYTLGFMLTNIGFSEAGAPFVETIKSSEPITTVILAFLLLGEVESAATYACLVPIVTGVAMASAGEGMGFTMKAFLIVQASNLGFSGRAVFVKQLKNGFKDSVAASSDPALFYHVSRIGLLFIIPVALYWEHVQLLEISGYGAAAASGAASVAASTPAAAAESEGFMAFLQGLPLFAIFIINGIFYTTYNLFSFFVLSRVSTSTHAVLNVFRRVVVIVATTLVFGTQIEGTTMVGVAMAVGGVLAFNTAKTKAAATKAKKA